MNILIDLRPLLSGNTSGVEIYTIELTKALIESNPQHNFILWINNFKKNKLDLSQFKKEKVEILQTRIPNKIFNLSLLFFNYPKIDKLLKRKIDFVFMPDLRPISKSKHYKIFCTIHDLSFLNFPNYFSLKSRCWYKLLNPKKLLKKIDHIFTVSNFSKKEILEFFKLNSDQVTVVYPGLPIHYQKQSLAHLSDKYLLPERYFLGLSTIEPRKNIKKTLQAFEQFQKKHPTIHLVIAGTQNPRLFAKYKLQIPPNTHFPGFIDDQDKYSLYQHSLGLIYLSVYEGFGLPIIEAAQAQIPILTANQTATKEIAPHEALLVDPNDISEISTQIEQLLLIKKPVIYSKDYLEKFSWNHCAHIISQYFS